MAEIKAAPACAVGANRFKEAVCIDALRIFDSCSDKDCLEDLQVFFTAAGQAVIDQSAAVKCKSAEILDVFLTVEPVPFNKGYFSVETALYFTLNFSCQPSTGGASVNIAGIAYHAKKVVLYGCDGCVKTYYSENSSLNFAQNLASGMPCACMRAVDPVALSSRVAEGLPAYSEPLGALPQRVADAFDGEIVTQPTASSRTVLVTLGLFTIITLEREVQLMIPSYDYVVPERGSVTAITPDDPCEIFKRVKFPVDEFFPDDDEDGSNT